MRPIKAILLLTIISSVLFCYSCNKDDNEIGFPRKVKIIRELPILYSNNSTERDTLMIIQDAEELNELYPSFPLSINFKKQTLIMGRRGYIQGLRNLQHELTELTEDNYVYTLTIEYYDTLPVGIFLFGIIINKIPSDSRISLTVNEINKHGK